MNVEDAKKLCDAMKYWFTIRQYLEFIGRKDQTTLEGHSCGRRSRIRRDGKSHFKTDKKYGKSCNVSEQLKFVTCFLVCHARMIVKRLLETKS